MRLSPAGLRLLEGSWRLIPSLRCGWYSKLCRIFGGKRGTGFTVITNMPPDVKREQEYQHDQDHYVEVMEVWAEPAEILAYDRTQVGQQERPGERAQESEQAEFPERHLRDAGGQ